MEYMEEKKYLTTSENYLKLQSANINSMIFKVLYFPKSPINLRLHANFVMLFFLSVSLLRDN